MAGGSLAGGFRLRGNNFSERLRVARLHCNHPQPRLGRNTAPLVDAFGMPRAPVRCGMQTRIFAPKTPVSYPPSPRAPPATAPGDPGGQVTHDRSAGSALRLRAAYQAPAWRAARHG